MSETIANRSKRLDLLYVVLGLSTSGVLELALADIDSVDSLSTQQRAGSCLDTLENVY
jgi:hypothetical protein